MAKAGECLFCRHHAQNNGNHQGCEGDDIVAEPPPEQEYEDRTEKRKQDDLIGRHGAKPHHGERYCPIGLA